MRSRFALKDAYPELEILFCEQLKIPPCPDDILFQELQAIHSKCSNMPLDNATQVHLHQTLRDLDITIRHSTKGWTRGTPPSWLKALKNLPFVPTELPSGDVVLKSLQDEVFLPDLKGDLAKLFRGRVPLVSTPPEESSATLLSLHRLFTSEWISGVKTLDSSVVCRLGGVGNNQRLLNVPLSRRYGSRMIYLRR